jgi:hypothetical protein
VLWCLDDAVVPFWCLFGCQRLEASPRNDEGPLFLLVREPS